MKLVVGGYCQGKLDSVLKHRKTGTEVIADGETCPLAGPQQADILNHFHLLVRRMLEQGLDPADYTREILSGNPDITIICDEVGMGIVPAEAFERQYRETVGRICCELAKQAESVERIVCGRSMKIK